ncbi:rod shape-determining protein [Halocatena salina]|uniref:Rod shape-determining protein n=1 Tax=Halocatena salina TaxID=2934340 RepID=A0A8U0A2C9_9EURY|nr:rod shape-determining protein [Halocatena salina]UPM43214.1 rod shape-determining protein [Halocatena salina]
MLGETPPVRGDRDGPVPIGIKIGSTRTVIARPDESGIETHATLTCLAQYEDVLSGTTQVIYGEKAAYEYPERVEFMLRTGLPEDDDRAAATATFFEQIVDENDLPTNSVAVYAIPAINNETGLRNLTDVIERTAIGGRLIRGYPESLCGSIPAFGSELTAIGRVFISINMGSTNIGACAYRHGKQLSRFTTGSIAGNEVDRWIATNVEEETQGRVHIDGTTAREYKEEHGDFNDFRPFTDVIQQPGGGTHEFTIERSVMDALDRYVDDAVDAIANEFLPQLATDHTKVYKHVLNEPIALTGGMAAVPGLPETFERRLGEELQHKVNVIAPEDPETAAARGAFSLADQFIEKEWY